MPTPINYPLINGTRHAFASIVLNVGTTQIFGFKAINFKRTRTRAVARGAHPDPLAKTVGDNEYTADLELYVAEYFLLVNTLQTAAGGTVGGYGNQVFTAEVKYSENGFDMITIRIKGCTLDDLDASHSQGPDALTIKSQLSPLKITLLLNGNEIDDLPNVLAPPAGS